LNTVDVAMAWLSKGGDWVTDDFPEEFCDDEELLLTVAKHNEWRFDAQFGIGASILDVLETNVFETVQEQDSRSCRSSSRKELYNIIV
jgi:hypothetical protein